MAEIADIIATVLFAVRPYSYMVGRSSRPAGKIDPVILDRCRQRVRDLITAKAAGPKQANLLGDKPRRSDETVLVEVIGSKALSFISQATDVEVEEWEVGNWRPAAIRRVDGSVLSRSAIAFMGRDKHDREEVRLILPADRADEAIQWLRDLSSGIVDLGPESPVALLEGPVTVREISATQTDPAAEVPLVGEHNESEVAASRSYFVGQNSLRRAEVTAESERRPQ